MKLKELSADKILVILAQISFFEQFLKLASMVVRWRKFATFELIIEAPGKSPTTRWENLLEGQPALHHSIIQETSGNYSE